MSWQTWKASAHNSWYVWGWVRLVSPGHPQPLPTSHALSRGPSQGGGGPGEAWVTHAPRPDASTSWQEDRHTELWQGAMSGPSLGQDLEAADLGLWDPYLKPGALEG